MNAQWQVGLRKRLWVKGVLTFETAWRVGSGREGGRKADLGVQLGADGVPELPGRSIRGKLRSTAESLAWSLGLSACFLDVDVARTFGAAAAAGTEEPSSESEPSPGDESSTEPMISCASDVNYYSRQLKSKHERVLRKGSLADLTSFIDSNTCDVCKLFGSPLRAGRLKVSDGRLRDGAPAEVEIRDGVVLDRDSHTAVDGLKYDYEVVSAGSAFDVDFEIVNPTDEDYALLGATLMEWRQGTELGGFVRRGLGRVQLSDWELFTVDFADSEQRRKYLMTPPDPKDPSSRWTRVVDPWEELEIYIGVRLD